MEAMCDRSLHLGLSEGIVTAGKAPPTWRAARREDAMTDQHPVEPDAIIGGDGSTVPYRRAGDGRAPQLPHALIPTVVRLVTAGPVLTASAFALAAVAAAKAAEMAGRMAWQVAARDAERRVIPRQVEVTWTRLEIRLLQ